MTTHWITLASGRDHFLTGPEACLPSNVLTLAEIAHSLAQLNRYTGHALRPYSVAEHSLLVCDIVRGMGLGPHAQRAALLHDAHEAYCSDIPSPFKGAVQQLTRGDSPLAAAEDMLQRAVLNELGAAHYYITYAAQVKRWDLISLATERRDLMHPAASAEPWPWLRGLEPDGRPIPSLRGMGWVDWATDFEARYHQLRAHCIVSPTPETTTP